VGGCGLSESGIRHIRVATIETHVCCVLVVVLGTWARGGGVSSTLYSVSSVCSMLYCVSGPSSTPTMHLLPSSACCSATVNEVFAVYN
jgi:hypothetical protein